MGIFDKTILAAYLIVNAFSVVQLVGSYRWPSVTRLVFCLIFGVAAYINIQTVLDSPWVYQDYADYAIPLYRWFILGPFEPIITPMVLSIAVGQALIAIAMLLKDDWFRMGCLGGIVFCLAIAPLGLGAAFPATALLALALYRLYRHNDRETIGEAIDKLQIPLPLD